MCLCEHKEPNINAAINYEKDRAQFSINLLKKKSKDRIAGEHIDGVSIAMIAQGMQGGLEVADRNSSYDGSYMRYNINNIKDLNYKLVKPEPGYFAVIVGPSWNSNSLYSGMPHNANLQNTSWRASVVTFGTSFRMRDSNGVSIEDPLSKWDKYYDYDDEDARVVLDIQK